MSFQTTPLSTRNFEPALNFSVIRLEFLLLALLFAMLGLAVFGPSVQQPGAFHLFANQGTWLGIEHAADVLSNFPFALGGLWGFWVLNRVAACERVSPRSGLLLVVMTLAPIGCLATP